VSNAPLSLPSDRPSGRSQTAKGPRAPRPFNSLSKTGTAALLLPACALVFAGYLLPGFILLTMSVGLPARFNADWFKASLDGFGMLVTDPYYAQIIGKSFLFGLVVALFTAILALPVAYYLARSNGILRSTLALASFTPVAVGMNMLTLGWMVILGKTGFINDVLIRTGLIAEPLPLLYNWGAVIVGMIHVSFTFMVMPVEAVIRQIDPSLEKAARTLGAGPLRTFFEIILPLSAQGIAAGFLIVFLQVVGAFVLPLLLGGQSTMLVPIAIWEQVIVLNNRQFAAVLSVTLILASFLVMLLQLRLARGKDLV
jgi:putative spermidine/putrescine transport system permease protein